MESIKLSLVVIWRPTNRVSESDNEKGRHMLPAEGIESWTVHQPRNNEMWDYQSLKLSDYFKLIL